MPLKKNTILKRCLNLRIDLRPDGSVKLKLNEKSFAGGIYTLAILDVFSTSTTFEHGLELLKSRLKGNRSWIELSKHMLYLHNIGVLEEADKQQVEFTSHAGRFDAFPVHLRMLFDKSRTLAFQKAIRETIKPSDIVLDIGTGSGVLAATAAMAGAKHVYAVELSSMGRLARKLFEANGLSDKITLIEGKSTNIELPEKADVLVSEIIGNDPLQEGVLPTTGDAIKRLLKKDARLIPDKLKIYALPVTVPDDVLKKRIFTEHTSKNFKSLYDIDYSPFVEASKKQTHDFMTLPLKAKDWVQLSAPVLVKELALNSATHSTTGSSHRIQMSQSGTLSGILVYFELKLGTASISTHPQAAHPDNHWTCKVWMPGESISFDPGDHLELEYRFDEYAGSTFNLGKTRGC